MIINIRHAGIVVFDLEASLKFYTEKLGFQVSKKMNESGVFIDKVLGFKGLEVTTVKMILGNGQMIELLDFSTHRKEKIKKSINNVGLTHLAFTVDNVDVIYNSFISDGIEFISNPRTSPDGFVKVAFCKAPEGTYIELVELLNE